MLPENGFDRDALVNRAMDVRTTAFNYITVHIKRESQYFGVAGMRPQFPI